MAATPPKRSPRSHWKTLRAGVTGSGGSFEDEHVARNVRAHYALAALGARRLSGRRSLSRDSSSRSPFAGSSADEEEALSNASPGSAHGKAFQRWPSRASNTGTMDPVQEHDTEQASLLSLTEANVKARYQSMDEAKAPDAPTGSNRMGPSQEDLRLLGMALVSKPLNLLLVFLPLGYLSYAYAWGSGPTFWLNFLAMVPLASMLGDFTEELAVHTGQTIGGLINATFGNAVEVVVAIQALKANEIRVVQASMLGSVLSNLLLVLGTCFLTAGLLRDERRELKFSALRFNATSAVANMSLLLLSSMAMVIPTLGSYTSEEEYVPLFISRVSAVGLMLMYILLLVFQLYTHRSLLVADEEEEEADLSATAAGLGLGITTILVSIFSDFLVSSIDGLTEEYGLTKTFVGVIILPIVGNAVEHVTAVTVAMKGKMELAMGVALGSGTQVAIFVVPVVVLSGWIMGREMSLRFPLIEIALYSLALLIVGHVVSKGHSNWLEGSMLIMTYLLIGLALFFEQMPSTA